MKQEVKAKIKESPSVKAAVPKPDTPKHFQVPIMSIKKEFSTGLTDNMNDNTDQPEILKHTKAGTNVPIPQTPSMMSILPSSLSFLPHSYFPSPAPLLTPGLMNIPSTSSFGSSLECLARAAKEQTRQYGHYSPANIPAVVSPPDEPDIMLHHLYIVSHILDV